MIIENKLKNWYPIEKEIEAGKIVYLLFKDNSIKTYFNDGYNIKFEKDTIAWQYIVEHEIKRTMVTLTMTKEYYEKLQTYKSMLNPLETIKENTAYQEVDIIETIEG